jgi:hypothetical protein
VEAIWQRSLALAAQTAKNDQNAAREKLDQIRIENDVRAQSFEMRERAYETATRERARALADSRDHLLSTLRMLESDRATLKARETRITELEAQVEDYRGQLAQVITRAVAKNRSLVERKARAGTKWKPKQSAKRRPGSTKPRRPPKSKRRSKR